MVRSSDQILEAKLVDALDWATQHGHAELMLETVRELRAIRQAREREEIAGDVLTASRAQGGSR